MARPMLVLLQLYPLLNLHSPQVPIIVKILRVVTLYFGFTNSTDVCLQTAAQRTNYRNYQHSYKDNQWHIIMLFVTTKRESTVPLRKISSNQCPKGEQENFFTKFKWQTSHPGEDPTVFLWEFTQLLQKANPLLPADGKTAILECQFKWGLPARMCLKLLEQALGQVCAMILSDWRTVWGEQHQIAWTAISSNWHLHREVFRVGTTITGGRTCFTCGMTWQKLTNP